MSELDKMALILTCLLVWDGVLTLAIILMLAFWKR